MNVKKDGHQEIFRLHVQINVYGLSPVITIEPQYKEIGFYKHYSNLHIIQKSGGIL